VVPDSVSVFSANSVVQNRALHPKTAQTFFAQFVISAIPAPEAPFWSQPPQKKVGVADTFCPPPPGMMCGVLNDRRVPDSNGTNQCIKPKQTDKQTNNRNTNTMNANTNRKLDMMKRVKRFILENPITPAIPRLTAAANEVTNVITALETAAQNQVAGSGQSEGGVDVRAIKARELREYLKNVGRTARALEKDHPGISPTFRLPRSGSYPALIAQARAIIAAATPLEPDFVDAGLPATFLTELQALLTAFEDATSQKHEGGITQVLGTAGLKAKATLGVKAATRLDAYVRNHFRNNPEMLAAWGHARRIEKAPVRNNESTTPPATPSSAPTPAGVASSSTSTVTPTS
jgi:hypothetical protein